MTEVDITLHQMDETIEEIDCFWLMWENVDWQENRPSPTDTNRYVRNIPFLPPIDCRPLVARNQFVSQTRLDDIIGLMNQNPPSPPPFMQPHSNRHRQSTCLVEETIHNISSAIHGRTINEILPSPQQADYIDLLEDRRSSYGTVLKSFTMMEEQKEKETEGYSSSEFWRSFLGSRYSSMITKFDKIQK